MRHELLTPINHILGYSEMLMEEEPLSPTSAGEFQRIHAGGRELQVLIARYFANERLAEQRALHQVYPELRAPVSQILGSVDLLAAQAGRAGRPDAVKDLAKIREAAAHWLVLMEAYLLEQTPAPAAAPAATAAATGFTLNLGFSFSLPDVKTGAGEFSDSGAILVVDDDESSREMLIRRLERPGYAVSGATNGLQALALARKQRFDLVMLDMIMPGLDGFQVLAKLKADPALRDMPVIMLSALDDENGIAACIELGAEDYLAKPFNPVFLRARISACLEKKRLRDREVSHLRRIEEEQRRSEELLHIILPRDVAAELKATRAVQPRRFEGVAVVFCDIVGFTAWCERHSPEEVLSFLEGMVESFERITGEHSLEKIKTIGDAFMAVGGMLVPLANPPLEAVRCGLAMVAAARQHPANWEVRVGIHHGPVIAGVVGRTKYQYDVWGDTVNTAMRMAQAASPGSVCVNGDTWQLLRQACRGRPQGRLPIKGKGELEVFQVEAIGDPLPAPGQVG